MRLLDDERRVGFVIAAAVTAALAAIWQPWQGASHALGFGLGVVFPAALAFAASRGHRVWTAFAAFVLAFDPAYSSFFVIGAVPLAYAFWLGYRGRRMLTEQEPPTPT